MGYIGVVTHLITNLLPALPTEHPSEPSFGILDRINIHGDWYTYVLLIYHKNQPLSLWPNDMCLMAEIPFPTTWDVSNLRNNGLNYQPQLVIAGFQPLTVCAWFTVHIPGSYRMILRSNWLPWLPLIGLPPKEHQLPCLHDFVFQPLIFSTGSVEIRGFV